MWRRKRSPFGLPWKVTLRFRIKQGRSGATLLLTKKESPGGRSLEGPLKSWPRWSAKSISKPNLSLTVLRKYLRRSVRVLLSRCLIRNLYLPHLGKKQKIPWKTVRGSGMKGSNNSVSWSWSNYAKVAIVFFFTSSMPIISKWPANPRMPSDLLRRQLLS